ncbi:hypothetical protein D3C72_1696270 [compost metagenome]
MGNAGCLSQFQIVTQPVASGAETAREALERHIRVFGQVEVASQPQRLEGLLTRRSVHVLAPLFAELCQPVRSGRSSQESVQVMRQPFHALLCLAHGDGGNSPERRLGNQVEGARRSSEACRLKARKAFFRQRPEDAIGVAIALAAALVVDAEHRVIAIAVA